MTPLEKMIKKLKVEICIAECLLSMTDRTARRNDMKQRLDILKDMRKALEDKPLK